MSIVFSLSTPGSLRVCTYFISYCTGDAFTLATSTIFDSAFSRPQ